MTAKKFILVLGAWSVAAGPALAQATTDDGRRSAPATTASGTGGQPAGGGVPGRAISSHRLAAIAAALSGLLAFTVAVSSGGKSPRPTPASP